MKIVFDGFETLGDLEETIMDAVVDLLDENGVDGEFTGKLVITLEYEEV
ncbi:MAG: hypothetical protein ACYSW8_25105 [Planctomycetota bacterium]|jgi:hypothetical protein